MPARTALILAILASSAAAAPSIDPQFGTHAVIQRGKPIVLTGTATTKKQKTKKNTKTKQKQQQQKQQQRNKT